MHPPRAQAPITPSASPAPASSSTGFFPAPYRIADESPPLKRQRHSSTTPRHARASSSSSATPDDFNIGREREASAMRMFDVWSQLAEKYTRRIDQDDIVDLVTGEIVKDRGVLSAEPTWKIGRFADIDDSTVSDEEDDDDVDELDSFAVEDKEEELPMHRDGWTVPPVRKMDPVDLKDLEEFMEAERRRKEECGDEEASEEDGDLEAHQPDAADSADDYASEPAQPPEVAPPTSHRYDVDESDDELDFLDGSNISYSVDKTKAEVIELLDSPSVSPTRSIATPKSKATSHPKTTPKSRPTSKSRATPKSDLTPEARATPKFRVNKPQPQLQLQLHTPPQSRTPSSVLSSTEDFDIPLSPPSSSPLPPPRIPRLDLAEMSRGRSMRARSSIPQGGAKRPKPTSSTVAEPDSRKRGEGKINRSSSALRPSSPPTSRAPRKGKEKQGQGESSPDPSDRKSKGRLVEAEPPSLHDDEDSSDPISLPSSPVRRGRQEATTTMRRSPRNKDPSLLQEHTSLPRSPEPQPQSRRKRKRKSLSLDGRDFSWTDGPLNDAPASFSFLAPPSRSTEQIKPRSSSVSAKLKSKRIVEEVASHPESDSEPEPELPRSTNRHPPPIAAMPPYYPPPGPFYPYPPYTPGTDSHPMPLQDPRAQFIISQAIHQLSTLYSAPWSAQPFTPPRHPPCARSVPSSGSSPYYPTTPHHPHAHPYVFDSGASMSTLPPSSPPGSSPPSLASSPIRGAGRRASLVPRSRSRGRRVSFKLDEEPREEVVLQGDSSDLFPTARGGARTDEPEEADDAPAGSSPTKPKQKDKGKKKMVDADANLSESEADTPRSNARPRIAERAQTPGPPIARTVETVAPVDSIQRRSSTALKPKGKTRKST